MIPYPGQGDLRVQTHDIFEATADEWVGDRGRPLDLSNDTIEQFFSHRGWPFVDERRIQQHLADLTELGLLARSGVMRHGYRYALTPAGEAMLEAAWAAEGR